MSNPDAPGRPHRFPKAWERRYSLRSLLDIVRTFEAARLMSAADAVRVSAMRWWVQGHCLNRGAVPNFEEFEKLLGAAQRLAEAAQANGLTTGLRSATAFWGMLVNKPDLDSNEFVIHAANAISAIEAELGARQFLELDPDKVSLYAQTRPFGDDVADAFPKTTYDAIEAANCLALHRPTASVFHSMRALEILLRTLARKLKVKAKIYNWETEGTVLMAILGKISERKAKASQNKRGQALPKRAKNKADTEFYATLTLRLDACKDVWRNNVTHANKAYAEEEAENVYSLVGQILRDAAKGGLREV